MKVMIVFAAPALLFAADAASAQTPDQAHDLHQASAHQRSAEGRCCCEEMMRKMMSEMMQKHQGMGMSQSKPNADQPAPAAREHQR